MLKIEFSWQINAEIKKAMDDIEMGRIYLAKDIEEEIL